MNWFQVVSKLNESESAVKM